MTVSIEEIVSLFTQANFLSLIKVFFLLALLIYLIFAAVVVRQVHLMMRALHGILERPLNIIVYLHLGLAMLVFLVALVLL